MATKKKSLKRTIKAEDFRIVWDVHAEQRFRQRILPTGVSKADFERLILLPNTPRKDEKDEHRDGDRMRRWVALPIEGRRRYVRIVYVEEPPGRMLVVTVLVESAEFRA